MKELLLPPLLYLKIVTVLVWKFSQSCDIAALGGELPPNGREIIMCRFFLSIISFRSVLLSLLFLCEILLPAFFLAINK